MTNFDLWKLSKLHEGIEFAVTRESINGRGVYRLYAGSSKDVWVPQFEGTRVLGHSHPAGEIQRLPSFHDINSLNKSWLAELSVNPMARPVHSRVVWGATSEEITLFRSTSQDVYLDQMKSYQRKRLGL